MSRQACSTHALEALRHRPPLSDTTHGAIVHHVVPAPFTVHRTTHPRLPPQFLLITTANRCTARPTPPTSHLSTATTPSASCIPCTRTRHCGIIRREDTTLYPLKPSVVESRLRAQVLLFDHAAVACIAINSEKEDEDEEDVSSSL